MVEEGDRADNLDVSLRWPKSYAEDEEVDSPTESPPPPLKGTIVNDPAPRRSRKGSSADPPPSRRSRKRATTPVAATVDAPDPTPPNSKRAAVDSTLSERMDRLTDALSSVTEQITALNERTGTLHDLVYDRLVSETATATSAPSGLSLEAHRVLTDATNADIAKALAASDKAVRRVERLTSALSVELAEIGQAVSDQVAHHSSVTSDELGSVNEALTDSLATITQQLEGLAVAVADNDERPPAAPTDHLEELVENSFEAIIRIETLVEALIEASDARPADISEFSARALERLGLTVGARFEANTTTAVENIDTAVNAAIDRAVAQFKEVAPPLVDRSTTAAITRLEERVAALTRQRDEHDRETKATLNGLEETVGRLASAQAEDLERILDTIEGASPAAPATTERPDAARLARIEASIAALADAPPVSDNLADIVAEQFATVNKHLDFLRRRLPLRSRTATVEPGLDERSLGVLAALIAERLHATAAEPTDSSRTSQGTRRTAPQARAAKGAPSVSRTPTRSRRHPPGDWSGVDVVDDP